MARSVEGLDGRKRSGSAAPRQQRVTIMLPYRESVYAFTIADDPVVHRDGTGLKFLVEPFGMGKISANLIQFCVH